MGDDGHVAGVLPDSPACQADEYVVGYDSPPYQRITLSLSALRQMNEAALVTYGQTKWHQLARLNTQQELSIQPVQIIKDIADVTIYTDYS